MCAPGQFVSVFIQIILQKIGSQNPLKQFENITSIRLLTIHPGAQYRNSVLTQKNSPTLVKVPPKLHYHESITGQFKSRQFIKQQSPQTNSPMLYLSGNTKNPEIQQNFLSTPKIKYKDNINTYCCTSKTLGTARISEKAKRQGWEVASTTTFGSAATKVRRLLQEVVNVLPLLIFNVHTNSTGILRRFAAFRLNCRDRRREIQGLIHSKITREKLERKIDGG